MGVADGGNSMSKGPGAGASSACFWNSLKARLAAEQLGGGDVARSSWPFLCYFQSSGEPLAGVAGQWVTMFAFCKDPLVTCLEPLRPGISK